MGVLVTLLAAFMAVGPAAPPDLFSDLFKRSPIAQRTLRSMRADFIETSTSSLLSAPLVARGTLVAAPPGRLAMTYTSPDPKTLVVNMERLVVTWPQRNQREELNIARTQERVRKYFADANPDQLRKSFDVRVSESPELGGTYLVDMTPTRKQIRSGLQHLQVWVDRNEVLPRQLKMTFPGGDTKTIRIDNLEQNVPVSDSMFADPGPRTPDPGPRTPDPDSLR
jgi:outer membrane lipoprotein-sorting protein